MDTVNETPSTEIVVIDADATEIEPIGFGKELGKTLAVSTATSAGVFGGFVLIALLTPKVKNWWANRKSNVVEGEVAETPTGPVKKD